jgi:hypothetical protein
MAVVIGGKRLWLWRAVDSEGEILDLLVQPRLSRACSSIVATSRRTSSPLNAFGDRLRGCLFCHNFEVTNAPSGRCSPGSSLRACLVRPGAWLPNVRTATEWADIVLR